MSRRKPITVKVSRGQAFVASVLGDELAVTPKEELERLTQFMDDYFAKEEGKGQEAQDSDSK